MVLESYLENSLTLFKDGWLNQIWGWLLQPCFQDAFLNPFSGYEVSWTLYWLRSLAPYFEDASVIPILLKVFVPFLLGWFLYHILGMVNWTLFWGWLLEPYFEVRFRSPVLRMMIRTQCWGWLLSPGWGWFWKPCFTPN